MAVHSKGARKEAEGCGILESLQLSPGRVVNKITASRMDDVEARRFRQGTSRTGLYGVYYTRTFRRDGVVKCALSKELKLTAREFPRGKAVNDRKRRFDEKQQAETVRLRSEIKYYEERPPLVVSQSPVRKYM